MLRSLLRFKVSFACSGLFCVLKGLFLVLRGSDYKTGLYGVWSLLCVYKSLLCVHRSLLRVNRSFLFANMFL